MLKFIQNNREITALLAVVLPGCAGTPRSADYLPDMSPRFLALAA